MRQKKLWCAAAASCWLVSLHVVAAQDRPRKVLFVCPHGAAKSVLASSYFRDLATERGLNVVVDFAGTEPDPAVAPRVVDHLKAKGIEPPTTTPRRVTDADIASADLVISLGCDLGAWSRQAGGKLRRWDDIPAPSENFEGADDAILKRVDDLVTELLRSSTAAK